MGVKTTKLPAQEEIRSQIVKKETVFLSYDKRPANREKLYQVLLT